MSWVDEVLTVAKAEIGTTEWPSGSNKVKYNTWYYGQEVSGAAYPWCMAFVQWVFARAGHTLPYKTASCSALLKRVPKHRAFGDYVLTPVPNAFNEKTSWWISKRDSIWWPGIASRRQTSKRFSDRSRTGSTGISSCWRGRKRPV